MSNWDSHILLFTVTVGTARMGFQQKVRVFIGVFNFQHITAWDWFYWLRRSRGLFNFHVSDFLLFIRFSIDVENTEADSKHTQV